MKKHSLYFPQKRTKSPYNGSKLKGGLNCISLIFLLFIFSCTSGKDYKSAYKNTTADSVIVGARLLLQNHLDELKGKRVGLVMNPTARVNGTHMLDTLLARNVNVTALFAPEHGFRGESGAGETIENGEDQTTGLPVFSLYGKTRKPTPKMLEKVDILLFDMQDVGARFYTYSTTLGLVLEAAANAEIPVWVLDRPNPAGGNYVAGWTLQPKYKSFVGKYPVPMAHGMTLGELAKMMIGEHWIDYNRTPRLKVIKMKGWNRSMKWPATGLKWHAPSPNLPTFEHAFTYLGTVLFEGTTFSEGRGTADPFLTIGSPQTNIPQSGLDSLRKQFPPVKIERREFTPQSIPGKSLHPRFEGEICHGVHLSVKNYDSFNPVKFGVKLLKLMLESTRGAKNTSYIYKLAGAKEVMSFSTDWQKDVEAFKKARKPYLIYK